MTNTLVNQFLERISKTKHQYCGSVDEKGFRLGSGCQQWFQKNVFQKFSGQFLYSNLHNKGFFMTDKNGDQTYFHGLFYANKLEGYGSVIYGNGLVFEGLFKQHTRFGPGVLTYPDGTQDVGIWDGFSLRRIIVTVGDDFVPRLGRTSVGKARLLRYRSLVPICVRACDRVKKMLDELGVNEENSLYANQLYNLHVRNPTSLFFNLNLYDNKFTEVDDTIDVIISQEEFEEESRKWEGSSQEDFFKDTKEDKSTLKEENSFECNCFRIDSDNFGQMCAQLQDVQARLEKVLTAKHDVEEKLQKCKFCCDHMLAEVNKIRDATVESQQEKQINVTMMDFDISKKSVSQHVGSKKVLSFSSRSENREVNASLTKSEIEIKNYFYVKDLTLFSEENCLENIEYSSIDNSISKGTLPFCHLGSSVNVFPSKARFSIPPNYDLYKENVSLEGEMLQFTDEFQSCYCNDLLIKNINLLKDNLKKLTQEELFHTTVISNIRSHLDRHFQKLIESSEENTLFIKKVTVTDLLAWNEENIWIEILQHCFRHRFSENNVNFSVNDLLTGHRNFFQCAGKYEASCEKFLEECSQGREKKISNYIRMLNINPDLCDVRGNTGLMLATIRDKTNVIVTLVNCGAKIDVMNDEGLTPLTVSFLKYLSFKFKVNDWEKAFLQEVKLINIHSEQWRPTDSILSTYNNSVTVDTTSKESDSPEVAFFNEMQQKFSYTLTGKQGATPLLPRHSEFDSKTNLIKHDSQQEQDYVLRTDFVRVSHENKINTMKKKRKKADQLRISNTKIKLHSKTKEKKKKETASHIEEVNKSEYEEKCNRKLDSIKKTILTLLTYGANPNVGNVPMMPIFLALFTDDYDLVENLLKNDADPNVTATNEDLTCLHFLASLKPTLQKVKMCEVLLSFKADPNLKTSVDHWSELNAELIGENCETIEMNNEGKAALHILCLREDFNCDTDKFLSSMANLLISNGCQTDELYLGHTALSLAVLRGNVKLIESVLKTKQVDPHVLLGNGMGNVLTILILNRFNLHMSYDLKQVIVKTLIDNGLNPLNQVDRFENVIAFMEYELHQAKSSTENVKSEAKTSVGKKIKNSKKLSNKSKKVSLKKGSNISSKISPKSRINEVKHLEAYIIEETRKILFRYLQGKAVRYLYDFIEESLIVDSLIVALSKFITPDEALHIIQLSFRSGMIDFNKFSYNVVCDLIKFVELQNESKHEQNIVDLTKINLICAECKKEKHISQIYFPVPEADKNDDKYKVCFQCLRGEQKKLLICPSCELVYFCSEKCNKLNLATDTQHKCNLLFYNTIKEIVKNTAQPSRLNFLIEMTKKLRHEKNVTSELEKLNEKAAKLKFTSTTFKNKVKELTQVLENLKRDRTEFAHSNNLLGNDLLFIKSHENEKKFYSIGTTTEINSAGLVIKLPFGITPVKSASSSAGPSTSNLTPLKLQPHPQKSTENVRFHIPNKHVQKKSLSDFNIPSRKNQEELSGPTAEDHENLEKPRKHADKNSSSQQTTENDRFHISKKHLPKKSLSDFTMTSRKTQEGISAEAHESLEKIRKHADQNYYMEMLSKIFADFNLPLLLLPYACYKDGQIYYSMSGNMASFGSGFYKLPIPN